MVRLGSGSIFVPITSEPVAEIFRQAGWQVTPKPLSAFTPNELERLRMILPAGLPRFPSDR